MLVTYYSKVILNLIQQHSFVILFFAY